MQQTKSYWWLAAVAGVVSAFVASACVVTTSTDDNGFAGSDAGGASAGSGGSVSSAGAPAGGSSAGAAPITAGSGGQMVAFTCDKAGDPVGTAIPNVCKLDDAEMTDNCAVCVKTSCCAQFSQCYAINPGDTCGWGGPKGDAEGEWPCYRACLTKITEAGDALTNEDKAKCAANCQTPKDSSGAACMDAIADATNDLIGCVVENNCDTACFGG